MTYIHHIAGETYHGRRGATQNAFRYTVDYVMMDAEKPLPTPYLFSRNARNVASLNDSDHGGAPEKGSGAKWVRKTLAENGIELDGRIEIIAQPRILGHCFNPVSFWLCYDRKGVLRVVIAEVNNTYGDRHSYFCHHDDLRPIRADETLTAKKIFYVSPFQPVAGEYSFRFDIRADRIAIRIEFTSPESGLIATLSGNRTPLTSFSILWALLRRPLGSRRVLALIHWQALRLWQKGVSFRSRPQPPLEEVSR